MLVLFISTCVVVSVRSMYMYQLHVHVYDVRVVRISRVIIFKVTVQIFCLCNLHVKSCIIHASLCMFLSIAHFSQP